MNDELLIRGEPKNVRNNLVDVVPLAQPYVIMIDPCDACNFMCKFCPTNISKANLNLRHKRMQMGMFEKIVDDLKQFPNKIKAVDLYGFGEPLLNDNLPAMIKFLKESEVCEKIRIATNGMLLTPELSEKLIEAGLDYMKISIEALDAKGYKEACGIEIDYDEFVRNISYLYSHSRGEMEIGAKIITSAFKTQEDRKKFINTFKPISDYTFIENLKNVWGEFEEIELAGENQGDDYYTENASCYEICSYPLTHMLIHSNGDICSCCFDWKHDTSYANVLETSLKEAWESERLLQFRLAHLNRKRNYIPFCNKCEMNGYDNVDDSANEIIKKLI